MLAIYGLADRLGRTVGEILEMPVDEFTGWIAYLKIIADRRA